MLNVYILYVFKETNLFSISIIYTHIKVYFTYSFAATPQVFVIIYNMYVETTKCIGRSLLYDWQLGK